MGEKKENYFLDDKIRKLVANIDPQYRCAIIFVVIAGILSHGMGLFNKYCIHDDIYSLFGTKGVVSKFGRWMSMLLEIFAKTAFGQNVSLPLWGGALSIICIAISACIMIKILGLRSYALSGLLGALLVTRPIIAGLFGYMYTLPYYMFGECMGLLGVYFIGCRYNKILLNIFGIALIVMAIGTYQALIPEIISMLLFRFIITVDGDELGERIYFRQAIFYVVSLIISVGIYFLVTQLFLWWKQESLVSYKGINEIWNMSYLGERIVAAYRYFFFPDERIEKIIYPGLVKYCYCFAILFCGCMTLFIAKKAYIKNKWNGILLAASIILMPMSVCFIYVMCAKEYVGGLMLYGQVMIFVYMVWLCERFTDTKGIKKIISRFAIITILIVNLVYIRLDNAVYLKANFIQERAISWHTVLISRIKSVEGYKDELPIAYIDKYSVSDSSVSNIPELDFVEVPPYANINLSINDYVWSKFVSYWCGFQQMEVTYEQYRELEELPEVKEMPLYPDDGSIKIIEDVIVVKFGSKQ